MEKQMNKFTIGLIAVISGLLVSMLLLLITGRNPLALLGQLFSSFTGFDLNTGQFRIRTIGNLLGYATPLLLTGLSVGFAFRTGLFNIGAEGQYIAGYVGSIVFAILSENWGLPTFIHLPLTVITAALSGALWGFIPGLLKAYYNTNEVVTTIMLNYTAMYFGSYLIISLPGSGATFTKLIPGTASLRSNFLESVFGGTTIVSMALFIALICALIYHVIIERTSFGYELRAVGLNKHASNYAGINVKRNIILSMMISGAFAGLAGAALSIGYYERGIYFNAFTNFGFDGIAVALVGGNTGIGILVSAFLFAGLRNSMPNLQINNIPLEIAQIIIGLIVLFVAMQYGINFLIKRIRNSRPKKIQEVE
jgi:general nucleoside transport system permease protein